MRWKLEQIDDQEDDEQEVKIHMVRIWNRGPMSHRFEIQCGDDFFVSQPSLNQAILSFDSQVKEKEAE